LRPFFGRVSKGKCKRCFEGKVCLRGTCGVGEKGEKLMEIRKAKSKEKKKKEKSKCICRNACGA
jgi:hypothetical protein